MHNFAILYVEDEEFDVLFLKQAFSRVGIPNLLKVVADGRQAIDYLSGKPPFTDRDLHPLPGLILLDLNLPYLSGFDVLKWIRKHPELKCLLVVAYTSSDQPRDLELAYELGVNGYLLKTSDPDKLCAMLKALSDYWLIHNIPYCPKVVPSR